jgi:hypothetical protein
MPYLYSPGKKEFHRATIITFSICLSTLLWWTIGSGTEGRFQSEMISYYNLLLTQGRWSSYQNSHNFTYVAQITRLWGSYINCLSFHSFRWEENKTATLFWSQKHLLSLPEHSFLSYSFVHNLLSTFDREPEKMLRNRAKLRNDLLSRSHQVYKFSNQNHCRAKSACSQSM